MFTSTDDKRIKHDRARWQRSLRNAIALLVATAVGGLPLLVPQTVLAQSQVSAPAAFSQQELDSMLAPIALYPDSLLSQILMAATYPLEVVEAARWSRANPDYRGDQAVRAVEDRDWDPSVKSLVAFPQVLSMMDQRLDWTEQLGDAFLDQESQVMDSVQYLRRTAYDAGNLRSTEQLRVESQGQQIIVEPVDPQIVYVPYYDPFVVYGRWRWQAPPVRWAPWPGYYAPRGVGVFAWGVGVPIAAGFFFGAFDWQHRQTRIVTVNNYYYNRTVAVNRADVRGRPVVRNTAPGVWEHDPAHRHGTPYRSPAVRAQFERDSRAAAPASRERSAAPSVNRNNSRGESRSDSYAPAARVEVPRSAPPPRETTRDQRPREISGAAPGRDSRSETQVEQSRQQTSREAVSREQNRSTQHAPAEMQRRPTPSTHVPMQPAMPMPSTPAPIQAAHPQTRPAPSTPQSSTAPAQPAAQANDSGGNRSRDNNGNNNSNNNNNYGGSDRRGPSGR